MLSLAAAVTYTAFIMYSTPNGVEQDIAEGMTRKQCEARLEELVEEHSEGFTTGGVIIGCKRVPVDGESFPITGTESYEPMTEKDMEGRQ